jgi:hypothetical protein
VDPNSRPRADVRCPQGFAAIALFSSQIATQGHCLLEKQYPKSSRRFLLRAAMNPIFFTQLILWAPGAADMSSGQHFVFDFCVHKRSHISSWFMYICIYFHN